MTSLLPTKWLLQVHNPPTEPFCLELTHSHLGYFTRQRLREREREMYVCIKGFDLADVCVGKGVYIEIEIDLDKLFTG